MKKLILLILFLIPLFAIAQSPIKTTRLKTDTLYLLAAPSGSSSTIMVVLDPVTKKAHTRIYSPGGSDSAIFATRYYVDSIASTIYAVDTTVVIVEDTTGADPACTGLKVYSLADSLMWQHYVKTDSVTGDIIGCEWVDISMAKWLNEGTTLYYNAGNVRIDKSLYTQLIYPKPGTATVNIISQGLDGDTSQARLQIYGLDGGYVQSVVNRNISGEVYATINRIAPIKSFISFLKDNVTLQKISIDTTGVYPEEGLLDLGKETLPFDSTFSNHFSTVDEGNSTEWNDKMDTLTATYPIESTGGKSPTISINDTAKRSLSKNVISLSASGILSDANIEFGSITYGTDQTAAIQAILDKAGSTKLTILWDCKVSVTYPGLRIKSNTNIIVSPGCGAILRPETFMYTPILCNYNRYVSASDSNITISGGIWNHNKRESSANTAHAIEFQRCTNLILKDNIQILDAANFALDIRNCRKVNMLNFVIDNGIYGGTTGSDGIHFWGWNSDIIIRDGIIKAFDDNIAFYSDYFATSSKDVSKSGPITNVLIENIYINNGINGLKFVSGSDRIDNVTVRNISGSTDVYALQIDEYAYRTGGWSGGAGNIGTIQIENFNVDLNSALSGYTIAGNIYIACNVEKLIFKDLKRPTPSLASTKPCIIISNDGGTTTVIDNLIIDGYDSYDSIPTSNTTAHIVIDSATVSNLEINRATVDIAGTAASPASLVRLTGGATVTNTMLNGVNLNKVKYIVYNDNGAMSSIVANNIIHSNADTSFKSNSTIASIVVSNYKGSILTKGTFTNIGGDASITSANAILHTNRSSTGYGFIFTNWLKNKNQSTAGQAVDTSSFWQFIYPSGTTSYGFRNKLGLSHLSIDTLGMITILDSLNVSDIVNKGSKSFSIHNWYNAPTMRLNAYGYNPIFRTYRYNGVPGALTATLSGNSIGYWQGCGYQTTTNAVVNNKANIFMAAAEDWTSTANGSYITFGTTPIGSTTIAERVRIKDDGTVGIGTSAPNHKLSVVASKSTNNSVFNLVNSDWNKNRTTEAQANDSSSFMVDFTDGGKPLLEMKNNTGGNVLKIDSTGTPSGTVVDKLLLKSVIMTFGGTGFDSLQQITTGYNKMLGGIAPANITIDSLHFVAMGASCNVTIKVCYGTDISASGTAVVTSPSAITSVTTKTTVSSFNNASVPAGYMIWAYPSAVTTKCKRIYVVLFAHRT